MWHRTTFLIPLLLLGTVGAALAAIPLVEPVSVSTEGVRANGDVDRFSPKMTPDGRFIVFTSKASNLVTGDTNGVEDVFVRDRTTGVTEAVSVTPAGSPGNGLSSTPSISDDGRFVAFESRSTNLVPGDGNGQPDIFLRDRLNAATVRVNVTSSGEEANAISRNPKISPDAQYVYFNSEATNLQPASPVGLQETYLYDRISGELRFPPPVAAPQEPSVPSEAVFSGNSRCLLVNAEGRMWFWNLNSDTYHIVTVGIIGRNPCIGVDGQWAAWSFNTGTTDGVTLYDQRFGRSYHFEGFDSGEGELINYGPYALSANGGYFVIRYSHRAANSGAVTRNYRFYRLETTFTPPTLIRQLNVTNPTGTDAAVQISNDGELLVISSGDGLPNSPPAPNGKSQVLLGRSPFTLFQTVSRPVDGGLANEDCELLALTPTGSDLLFQSKATNLGGGNPEAYNQLYAVMLAVPPAAPTLTAAEVLDTNRVRLTWSNVDPRATRIEIEARENGTGAYRLVANAQPNTTQHIVTGLTPNTSFAFRIRATNRFGASPYSNILGARTDNPLPYKAPTNLTGLPVGESIRLTWTDNNTNETGTQIWRWSAADPTYRQIGTVGANVTTFTDVGLPESTQCVYYVIAFNNAGRSPTSAKVSVYSLPAAPSGLTANALTSTIIDLAWTDNSAGEIRFQIFFATDADPVYRSLALVNPNVQKYRHQNLTPGTRYLYFIRAVGPSGSSKASNKAFATTPN